MKKPMYAIFDNVACTYNNPFCFVNEAVALRSCSDLLDSENEISLHPDNYSCWHIADYDTETAEITVLQERKVLCRFHELQAVLNSNN